MPVQVNPNVPLGLNEFAQIYTGNGQTPQQNSSNLWFNAPAEGRSYMEDQWSRLNTGTSPEAYFSDPAHVAALLAPPQLGDAHPQLVSDPLGRIPVSSGNTGQEQWPMYASEAARSTAFNLGMDRRGAYNTPDQMLADVTTSLARAPHDPEHLLRNPQLQQMMTVNPTKAKFVYEKLTGASYDKDKAEVDSIDRNQKITDLNQARKDNREPFENAKELVKDMIKRNAHYDPATGKLMEWQQTAPDANAIDQRPVMQRVEVPPEKDRAWHSEAYHAVTGMPAPIKPPIDPQAAAASQAVAGLPPDASKRVQANIDRFKAAGANITPQIINQFITKDQVENKPVFAAPGEDSHYGDMTNSFYGNMMGRTGWQPGMSDKQINGLPQNAWGKIAAPILNLKDTMTGLNGAPVSGDVQRPFNWAGDTSRSWLDRILGRNRSPQQQYQQDAVEAAAREGIPSRVH